LFTNFGFINLIFDNFDFYLFKIIKVNIKLSVTTEIPGTVVSKALFIKKVKENSFVLRNVTLCKAHQES
jgi:hypothetical protein